MLLLICHVAPLHVIPLFIDLLKIMLLHPRVLARSSVPSLSWPILNILIFKIPFGLLHHRRDPTLANIFVDIWRHLRRLHLDAIFLPKT